MPRYLLEANYVGEGISGLLKEGGSSRRDAVTRLINSVGGTVESFYYAFGDTDCYLIVDAPDHASITAAVLTAAASGRATVKTTVLLTPEELDEASKKSAAYRAPGT